MKIVIQRVTEAAVLIDEKVSASIEQGMLILLGIEHQDEAADADWLVQKVVGLRLFNDEQGKMNETINAVDGQLLVVSQFTLFASTKKGNRPSFIQAAAPEKAIPLYTYFIQQLEIVAAKSVQTGVFGAAMKIRLINDGPVTIIIDSKKRE
jgi:D-tyrosyl-tRNA(Tyr) deacylase